MCASSWPLLRTSKLYVTSSKTLNSAACRPLPADGIDSFMSGPTGRTLTGSALEYSYNTHGRLVRSEVDSCSWSDRPAGGPGAGVSEVWYSSGAYSRCPVSLKSQVDAEEKVVFEAGAILYR